MSILDNDQLAERLARFIPELVIEIAAASDESIPPVPNYRLLKEKFDSHLCVDDTVYQDYAKYIRFLFFLADRLCTDLLSKANRALSLTRLPGAPMGPLVGTPTRNDYVGVYQIYTILAVQFVPFLPQEAQKTTITAATRKINFPEEWLEQEDRLNAPEKAMVDIQASLASVRYALNDDLRGEVDGFRAWVVGLVRERFGGNELPSGFSTLTFHGEPEDNRRPRLDEIAEMVRKGEQPAGQVVIMCTDVIGPEPNQLADGTYLLRQVLAAMTARHREKLLQAQLAFE